MRVLRHLEAVLEVAQLPEFPCSVKDGKAAADEDEEAVWNSQFLGRYRGQLSVRWRCELGNLEHFLFLIIFLLNLRLFRSRLRSNRLNFDIILLSRLAALDLGRRRLRSLLLRLHLIGRLVRHNLSVNLNFLHAVATADFLLKYFFLQLSGDCGGDLSRLSLLLSFSLSLGRLEFLDILHTVVVTHLCYY